MIRTHLLLSACFVFITTVSGFANMRAPYTWQTRGTEEIRCNINGLTVMKEELLFDADAPYKGKLDDVMKQRRNLRVQAVYTVSSSQKTTASFDFITTEPVEANVLINNISVPAGKPVLVHEDAMRSWIYISNNKHSVSFSGKLREGINTITVTYSHQMSVFETDYGYFTKSTFSTMFQYHLFPLKEWKIDPSFTMNIIVRFKDDTGWSKSLFGSDYTLSVYGSSKDEKNSSSKELPYIINKKSSPDIYEAVITFASEFPDTLSVSCSN